MPFQCSRLWCLGSAFSSLSFDAFGLKFKHQRGDGFLTSQLDVASLPCAGENVATSFRTSGEWRCSRKNGIETEKHGGNSWAETVSRASGSGLNHKVFVDKFIAGNFKSWEIRGLRRDSANAEVEVNTLDVEENELPPVDDKIGEAITSHSWGNQRPADGRGRRAALLAAGSVVLSNVICLCCSKASAEEWDYGNPSGVTKWRGLCAVGPKQSPVDIPLSKAKRGESPGELQFDFGSSSPTILNPGHGTMQVSFAHGKNVLRVGGRVLELLQFHFHAPSEHAFDGDRFAMEAHLVHCDVISRRLAVVGIMLDASKYALPNKGLAESLAYAPAEHGQSVHVQDVAFSPSLLLPPAKKGKNGSRDYIHYVGSLSTPPCSEGVDWFVLETPVEIATSQVLDFMKFAGDGHSLAFNSRPLQPLGDRVVYEGP